MTRRRADRPRAAAEEPVSWRDGVHITGTPIWCDARRARDVCFVSHAHAVPGSRHGQLVATAATLALVARADRRLRPDSELAVPCGRPFTLGQLRLELLPSGHCVGAAALLVEVGGRRVLYAGAVDPRPGGLGGAAELRPSDVLVVGARYGHPRFAFPAIADAAAQVVAFSRDAIAAGAVPIALVSSPAKGLDVADALGRQGLPVRAHRAIHHASQRLRAAGIPAPTPARFSGRARAGEVLLWPVAHRDRLDALSFPGGARTALVSGAALEEDEVATARVDLAVPWASQGDHASLLRFIDDSGAGQIYVTGRYADEVAAAAAARGRDARTLGPPRQMPLFGAAPDRISDPPTGERSPGGGRGRTPG